MAGRTFAIGDIHGELEALERLLAKLPELDSEDTLVFMGDYVDRGEKSAHVVALIRHVLPLQTPAKVVPLMGNHEDGWLQVRDGSWPQFVLPPGNGCRACALSYLGPDTPDKEVMEAMFTASFFPEEVLEWMQELAWWYEDEHAIYVHAGLREPREDGSWPHPSEVEDRRSLVWTRSKDFFLGYEGKRIVIGHTPTPNLPPEYSEFTPEDPMDMWVNNDVFAIDTGCGKGGFLTALELPSERVYESRDTVSEES